jgi:hypothetical protein
VITFLPMRQMTPALLLLTSCLPAALLLLPPRAQADILTFNDSTESPTVDLHGSTRMSGSCTGETCSVTITGPAGMFDGGFTNTLVFLSYVDPGTTNISDKFDYELTLHSATITFTSDSETPLGTCPTTQLLFCPAEDGTVQTWNSILWHTLDGKQTVTDTIQFQSDVDAVPEPSALVLLSSCMLGVGLVVWKRRFHQQPEA